MSSTRSSFTRFSSVSALSQSTRVFAGSLNHSTRLSRGFSCSSSHNIHPSKPSPISITYDTHINTILLDDYTPSFTTEPTQELCPPPRKDVQHDPRRPRPLARPAPNSLLKSSSHCFLPTCPRRLGPPKLDAIAPQFPMVPAIRVSLVH